MSSLNKLWLKWKSLRLPWRKQFCVGQDLKGNTYWQFRDTLDATRLRRIVRFPGNSHHADVHVSPLWHQWLRHTRADPPSLQEQSADVLRQTELKHNAMLADTRWNAKARYIDSPKKQPSQRDEATESGAGSVKKDPWAAAQQNGEWKPDAWVPGPTKR